ncbi:hypothetical protein ABZ690_28150 [Streptomyces sp. NPDC006967]|uniref:hypothetical protein n=1 Tax=Streptomyces sp. NPDC006967 TaxID=3156906 RepID=UPI0033D8B7CB
MEEHSCAKLGRCNNPFHDHDADRREQLPPVAELVETDDPAFETIARILTDMRDAGAHLTADTVRAVVALGRHYHQRAEEPLPVPAGRLNQFDKALVYYVRFGTLIKIGTTRDMRQRMLAIRPDEILAAEPGSYELEAKRHRQFARSRSHGELFMPSRPLVDHINALRKKYGRTPKKRENLRRSRPVLEKATETLF